MTAVNSPAPGVTKYNFNTIQEIKSHSSILYNERMAILFYLQDMKNLMLHKHKSVDMIYDCYSVLRQIYKNFRMLIRFNPMVRVTMNLETKDPGIYTVDVAMSMLDKMIKYCEETEFTQKRIYIIIQEMDNIEMIVKDVLQYFSYFIRPDFSQKPDIESATEKYKEISDKRTVDELKAIVGKNHSIDFEGLGSERVEIDTQRVDYDPTVDSDLSEYIDSESEDLYIDDGTESSEKNPLSLTGFDEPDDESLFGDEDEYLDSVTEDFDKEDKTNLDVV
jgi:hypothetical protein